MFEIEILYQSRRNADVHHHEVGLIPTLHVAIYYTSFNLFRCRLPMRRTFRIIRAEVSGKRGEKSSPCDLELWGKGDVLPLT